MLTILLLNQLTVNIKRKQLRYYLKKINFSKQQKHSLYLKSCLPNVVSVQKNKFLLPIIITTKSVNNKYMSNVWLSHVYFRSLMQTMTGFYTNWQFMNINTFADRDDFALLWYRIYNRYRLGRLYTSRGTFFAWFVQLTYFKDPKFLIVFIKKVLLNSHLKHHRRMFSFINKFLKLWYLKVAKLKKLKGYSLFFKGKLGKKGSVRKAKFFAKKGLVSFTNKSLRVNYRTYFIWTHTGVIGAGISIFY